MPFYIISNESYIKDNKYKFGYSSKSKDELLKQYEKNRRYIINPLIINWWDIEGSIKKEKEIHNILCNSKNIYRFNGEWYKCENLYYLMNIINEQINKSHDKDEKVVNLSISIDELCNSFNVFSLYDEEQVPIYTFYNLRKNNKDKIIVKYDITNLFNNKEKKLMDKYKKENKNFFILVNETLYLSYDFFIWFIKKEIENTRSKEIIIKLNKIIKEYIFNIDVSYFNNLIYEIKKLKKTNFISFSNNSFPVCEEHGFVEIEMPSLKSSKDEILLSTKEYINKNKHLLHDFIYGFKDVAYFIRDFNIYNIEIKIYIGRKQIELTLDDYLKYNKKIINLYNKSNMKIYKQVSYNIYLVMLNYNIKSDMSYKILNLEKEDLFENIFKDNIYEDINVYINEKTIKIKKLTLYQMFNYNNN